MISQLIYRMTYRLSRPNWDTGTTPQQLIETLSEGNVPPGPALDLGCGTGTNVVYMAQHGRTTIGIDFAPEAIAKARQKAQQAKVDDKVQFLVADVTRLDKLALPLCSFALDMGCFHGLNPQQQRHYLEGLSARLSPGSCFLLYVIEPRQEAGIVRLGMSVNTVQAAVAPWFEVIRSERDNFWHRAASWIWLKRLV